MLDGNDLERPKNKAKDGVGGQDHVRSSASLGKVSSMSILPNTHEDYEALSSFLEEYIFPVETLTTSHRSSDYGQSAAEHEMC